MKASRRLLVLTTLTTLFASWPGVGSTAGSNQIVVDDCYHAITTVRDMYSLAIALEAYGADHGKYPVVQGVDELRPLLAPAYIVKLDLADAWGTMFRYEPTADGKSYRLISAGSDRKFDEASWSHPGVFTDSKEDAVWSNHFARKWAIDVP